MTSDCAGVTELQAGGGIFADPWYRHACKLDGFDYSLSVLATVVSRPARDRAVLDAGLKAISPLEHPPITRDEEIQVGTLHAEHCELSLRGKAVDLEIGARVELIPGSGRNGSQCLMVDAEQNAYFTLSMKIAQEVMPGYDYALSLWLRSDRKRQVPFVLSVRHESGKQWRYSPSVGLDERWQQCCFVLSVPKRSPGEPAARSNSLTLAMRSGGRKGAVLPAMLFVDDVALTCLGRDISD